MDTSTRDTILAGLKSGVRACSDVPMVNSTSGVAAAASAHRAAKSEISMRGPLECRPITIRSVKRLASGDVCAEVCLGATRAVAAVSAEVVTPAPERPSEGRLRVFVAYSPLAMPPAELSQVSAKEVELSALVEGAIKDAKAIDVEALCIVSGAKSWDVRVDVKIINDDGNCEDLACFATMTGLCAFRLPVVEVTGTTASVFDVDERAPVPLSLHHVPIATTFGLYHSGEVMAIDPNHREELVMEGALTIVCNSFGEVCATHKFGMPAVSPALIQSAIDIATEKCKNWEGLIRESSGSK